jgi:hypothetical protein
MNECQDPLEARYDAQFKAVLAGSARSFSAGGQQVHALTGDQALALSIPCMVSQLTKASNQPVLVVSFGYMPKP